MHVFLTVKITIDLLKKSIDRFKYNVTVRLFILKVARLLMVAVAVLENLSTTQKKQPKVIANKEIMPDFKKGLTLFMNWMDGFRFEEKQTSEDITVRNLFKYI